MCFCQLLRLVKQPVLLSTWKGEFSPLMARLSQWVKAVPRGKVLRVLGNLLALPAFDFESVEQIRVAAFSVIGDTSTKLNNYWKAPACSLMTPSVIDGLQRMGEWGIYHSDALVRRAPALQSTTDAQAAYAVYLSLETASALALALGFGACDTGG